MVLVVSMTPVMLTDSTGYWSRWITVGVTVVSVIAVAIISPFAIPVIIAVGAFTLAFQMWHFDQRQSLNTNLPNSKNEADDMGWDSSVAANFHQYTALDEGNNIKYVSPDGKREVIYNYYGDIVSDSRDVGTYNFSPSGTTGGTVGHIIIDVLPWVLFGNDDDDPGPLINELRGIFK